MTSTDADRYHHGDLNNELRRVAADLIAEKGVAGFSLREVARRAGVSHAAPTHHFGDVTGLFTAIAIDAFRHMHASVVAAGEGFDDPRDRLVAMGRAYVEVSVSNPGHCAVAFRHDLVHHDDPDYERWSDATHGLFFDCVAEIHDQGGHAFDIAIATSLGWAALQGLTELYTNMQIIGERHGQGPLASIGDLAEQFSAMLIVGFTASTTTPPN